MTKISDNGEELADGMKPLVVGHLLIRDKVTGEVLLRQRDTATEQVAMKGDIDAAD